jgi:hypothetical protein
MKAAFMILVLILGFGLVSATIDVRWLDEPASLDGNRHSGEYFGTEYEEGHQYSYGYKNGIVFLEFRSADDTNDEGADVIDVFLKFEKEGGGEFADYIEMIFHRNGTAYWKHAGDEDYSDMPYDFAINPEVMGHGGVNAWRAEVAIPMEDLSISKDCHDQVGYLIRIYDNYVQTVNFDKSSDPFISSACWATPMDVYVVLDENNPEKQTYYGGTENNTFYTLAFGMFPPGFPDPEEPAKVESITFDAEGTGDDEHEIDAILLYADNPENLIGKASFDVDDGQAVIFPEDLYVMNQTSFVVELEISKDADAHEEGPGESAATFFVSVSDIQLSGRHTGEGLDYVVMPEGLSLESNGIYVYDCLVNESCPDDQFCKWGYCREFYYDCGYAMNHVWYDYECCDDEDCGEGLICDDHECAVAPEEVECTSNDECDDDEICAGGGCQEIHGLCGYAEDHEWKNYECCNDLDCPPDEECVSHTCVVELEEEPEIPELNGSGEPEIPVLNGESRCISEGCDVEGWSSCRCDGEEIVGHKSGRCRDNCGNIIYKNITCRCEVVTEPQKEEEPVRKIVEEESDYMDEYLLYIALVAAVAAVLIAYWLGKRGRESASPFMKNENADMGGLEKEIGKKKSPKKTAKPKKAPAKKKTAPKKKTSKKTKTKKKSK